MLGGITFWMLVVYYLMQMDPVPGNEVDFMMHPKVRQLMAEDIEHDKTFNDLHPEHIAHVNITAHKSVSSSSSSSEEEVAAAAAVEGDTVEIVFGVCCRDDYSAIERLSSEFISVFYTTAIGPLQKATTMTELKTKDARYVDRLSTLLSTEDINVTFKKADTSIVAPVDDADVGFYGDAESVAPLMMTFTISGGKAFLSTFTRQLWLKSPLLESGLFTTIEAHLLREDDTHRQGVLAVRWVSPRYKVPVVSLNSVHLDDLMSEIDAATNTYKGVLGHHKMDSAALERQQRRTKALQREKDSLAQLIRQASQCVYPRLNVAFNQLILGEMRHLKTRSFYIERQIESLKLQHESLTRVLEQTERQYNIEDASAKSNTINIAHLEERLALLHHRRIEVISELKKMVKRFSYMAHLIVYYEIYLREKQRHEARYIGQRFKFDANGICAHSIAEFECGQRAIFCEGADKDRDLFEGDDVEITAEVSVAADVDHSVYLYANFECEALVFENVMRNQSLTTHQCARDESGPCDLVMDDKQAIDSPLSALCVYVECDTEEKFKVKTKMTLKGAAAKESSKESSADKAAREFDEKQKRDAEAFKAAQQAKASREAREKAKADEDEDEEDDEQSVEAAGAAQQQGSKATVTITKEGEGAPLKPTKQPKPTKKGKGKGKSADWEESAGSELQRSVTIVATVFFSVVALVMSVLFMIR